MSALKPKGGFSAGVLGILLPDISGLILAKPTAKRRAGGLDRAALALAQTGRYILCRNASDDEKIERCRTTEVLSAASASSA